jgi:hypothetical protein
VGHDFKSEWELKMIESVKADIVTDASGNATVFLAHGINRKPTGLLLAIKYTPGTLATGADLTITGESSGIPILVVTDAGIADRFFYPRALLNNVADASAGSGGTEIIPIRDERIKVVVAQGGNAGVGSIEAILLTDSPY